MYALTYRDRAKCVRQLQDLLRTSESVSEWFSIGQVGEFTGDIGRAIGAFSRGPHGFVRVYRDGKVEAPHPSRLAMIGAGYRPLMIATIGEEDL